jgi:uncharacterized protein (DUF427 family)
MSLTLASGPLSTRAAAANFRIEGPDHRLFFDDFPRRVRARFAGETVLDTHRGKLLHETRRLPQLYVPLDDVRFELLVASEHRTCCPFKGEACYWSLRVGERMVENAAWAYPEPLECASWLRDYLAFYWQALDAWYDEDEEVHGHLRDPYHRVDVRETSRHLRVRVNGEIVAETQRPKILTETGLPPRFYIPPDDVRTVFLEPSAKQTVCPYKGTATYHTLIVHEHRIADAAWTYAEPFEDAARVRNHFCFDAEGVALETVT